MATKTTKKKPTAKKVTKKSNASYKHFKLEKSIEPFLTFKLTLQSLYWTILILFIAGIAVWVINLQISINAIYDRIEEDQRMSTQMDTINRRVQENKRAISENKTAINSQKTN